MGTCSARSALRYQLFTLTSSEIPDLSLNTALNDGLILPPHYGSRLARQHLESYIGDYYKEEIAAKALTRNVPAFSRFLEMAALGNGEMLQFSNIR